MSKNFPAKQCFLWAIFCTCLAVFTCVTASNSAHAQSHGDDNTADIYEADYDADLNRYQLLAGHRIQFRRIEHLHYPATFYDRLQVFHVAGMEYAAVNLEDAHAVNSLKLFDAGGRSAIQITLPETDLWLGMFIAWDYDRDGTDEIVTIERLLNGGLYREEDLLDLLFRSKRANLGTVINGISGGYVAVFDEMYPSWEDQGQIVDIEGDGYSELVLRRGQPGHENEYVFVGELGEMLHPITLSWRFPIHGTSDTNLDGTPELISQSLETGEIVRISRNVNLPEKNFAGEFEQLSGVLDLDGDGNAELVDAGNGYWNPATASFTKFDPPFGNRDSDKPENWIGYKTLGGDLDADGSQEIILLYEEGNYFNRIGIYELDGSVASSILTDCRVVDAVVINREVGDYLLLHTFGAMWAYP